MHCLLYCLLHWCRYDMAASFFLLANCTSDAIGVLARERGDPQLALLVARLTESNNGSGPGGAGMGPGGVGGVVRAGPGALAMESVPLGPAGSQLVKEELMPLAEACGDPGAVALVLWTEGKRPEAVQHLVAASARLRGLGPPGQDAAGAAGALSAMRPSSFPVTVDPCALDWVVQCGVYQLSGRWVRCHVMGDLGWVGSAVYGHTCMAYVWHILGFRLCSCCSLLAPTPSLLVHTWAFVTIPGLAAVDAGPCHVPWVQLWGRQRSPAQRPWRGQASQLLRWRPFVQVPHCCRGLASSIAHPNLLCLGLQPQL